MSVLEGQKKEEKRKKSVQFVSKADIIAIRINQTATIYVITFVLMHIEKWCLHLGPTTNMYLYFFHLLLSTAIVKNPNSPMLFHYLTLQLNWTRWVYNTLWGQSGKCIILLLLILVNFVLIAINWFGQSLASSPEMTGIAKVAFCTFCAKTKRTTTKTTITKTKRFKTKYL